MSLVPVFCDNCGAVFASHRAAGRTDAKKIQITGMKVGPCPNCGGMGSVPDGVYGLIDDALTVVHATDLPATTLQEVISVLEDVVSGVTTGDQALKDVEERAPDLVPVINVYLQRADPMRWVMLLLAILTVAMAGPGTANDVVDLLHKAPQRPEAATPHSARSSTNRRKAKPRRNREPKTHGKHKKRRRN